MAVDNREDDVVIQKPERTWSDTFKSFVYWTFPLTALWGVTRFTANALLGKKIIKMVFPAVNTQDPTTDLGQAYQNDRVAFDHKMKRHKKKINQKIAIDELVVRTGDGARLRTLELDYQGGRDGVEEYKEELKPYIIKCCGNDGYYEKDNILQELMDDAKEFKGTVVAFNYRNVGKSEGKLSSTRQLVIDGIAQVQRLRNQNVAAGNIFLKSHSFGAAVAAEVVAHFHSKGYPIRIDSSRSFSRLSEVLLGWVRTGGSISKPGPTGHTETLGGRVKAFFIAPFLRFLFAVTDCEITPEARFKKIPATHRDHYCVRSPKEMRENDPQCIDDPVIPHSASLYASLQSERRETKAKIKSIEGLLKSARQTDGIVAAHLQPLEEQLQQTKALYRLHKMVSVPEVKEQEIAELALPKLNGHSQPTSHLINRCDGNTAKVHFKLFVERSQRQMAQENDYQVQDLPPAFGNN